MTKDEKYMAFTETAALLFSKDRSSQIAAVIISPKNKLLSMGYNGFLRGADDNCEARHERPAKYFYTEHAERNALYNTEADLEGARIYVAGMPPCADCARGIVQKGLSEVIVRRWDETVVPERWKDSYAASWEMFHEHGLKVVVLGGTTPITLNGRALGPIAPG